MARLFSAGLCGVGGAFCYNNGQDIASLVASSLSKAASSLVTSRAPPTAADSGGPTLDATILSLAREVSGEIQWKDSLCMREEFVYALSFAAVAVARVDLSTCQGSNFSKLIALADAHFSKVRALSEEIRGGAASRGGSVTVLAGVAPSGRASLLWSVGVPVVSVGVVYLAVRGFHLDDFLYVTRKGFRLGVRALSEGVCAVAASVVSTRRELGQRLRELDAKVDEAMIVSQEIRDQFAGLKEDLGALGEELSEVHASVRDVARQQGSSMRQAASMAVKIEQIRGAAIETHTGVHLLCSVTADALAGSSGQGASASEMRAFVGGGGHGAPGRVTVDAHLEGDAPILFDDRDVSSAGAASASRGQPTSGLWSLVGGHRGPPGMPMPMGQA